jgi:hypothetical protein
MKKIFLLFAVLLYNIINAQTISWSRQIGTTGDEQSPYTITDNQNNLWLFYYVNNSDKITHVVKYDANGNLLLDNTINNFFFTCIQSISANYFDFVGSSLADSVVLGNQVIATPQYIKGRMDLNGIYFNVMPVQLPNSSYNSSYQWSNFKFDQSENLFVAGTMSFQVLIGEYDHLRKGFHQSCFLKIDTNGFIQDTIAVSGLSHNYGIYILPISGGLTYCTSQHNNFRTDLIDANHDTLWTSDFAAGMIADASDNIYFMGQSSGSLALGNFNLSGNYFIAKKDAGHNYIWAHSLSSNTWMTSNIAYLDPSTQNFYVSGIINDTLLIDTIQYPVQTQSVYLISFDKNGNFLWLQTYSFQDSVYAAYPQSMTADSYNNRYLAGIFHNTIQLDNNYATAGKFDVYLMQIKDHPAVVFETDSSHSELSFSNPSDQVIKINLPAESGFTNVDLFDLSGNIIKNVNLKNDLTITSSTLSEGNYILRFNSKNKFESHMITVIH